MPKSRKGSSPFLLFCFFCSFRLFCSSVHPCIPLCTPCIYPGYTPVYSGCTLYIPCIPLYTLYTPVYTSTPCTPLVHPCIYTLYTLRVYKARMAKRGLNQGGARIVVAGRRPALNELPASCLRSLKAPLKAPEGPSYVKDFLAPSRKQQKNTLF